MLNLLKEMFFFLFPSFKPAAPAPSVEKEWWEDCGPVNLPNIPGITITESLASGGMGRVWAAGDTVVKTVLNPALYGEMFKAEVNLQTSLKHPNILPILNAGGGAEWGDTPLFCQMPRMDADLQETADLLFPEEKSKILKDLGNAIQYLNENGYVHMDIKPLNTLVNLATGTAYLSDFGLASKVGELTLANGTPAYKPPEQSGIAFYPQPSADVYTFCATSYYVLVGKESYQVSQDVIIQHLLVKGVDARLASAITLGFEKNPQHRPSISEILELL